MHFVAQLLLLICLAFAGLPAAEARRVALVIGNAHYKIGPLQNPGNDATAIAGLLTRIGFDKVMLRRNLDIQGFRAALREMSREAAGAEVGVVYFAGHGTEVNGRNFLIPVDAVLNRAGDLDLEGIALDAVLNQLTGVTKLRLVILDACRNNVFPLAGAKRAGSRGLARVEPQDNTLIAYAAKDGTTADDGVGRPHSPFTEALLKHMGTPGLDIRLMLGKVRDQVLAATGRQQQPFAYGSVSGEVIALMPGTAVASPAPPKKVETPAQAPSKGKGQKSRLFTAADLARVRAFAEEHKIPMPAAHLEFVVPKADVPEHLRRFVGVWADERGPAGGRGRKFLLIVTNVDKDGRAEGYWAWGPAGPASVTKSPPSVTRIAATLTSNTLSFSLSSNSHKFTRAGKDRLSYFWWHKSGRSARSVFEPVWTLLAVEAKR